MNSATEDQALSAIRQDLGGLGLGLLLGAIACYLVRPKTKAATALEMAQHWLAWGLLASITSGVSFWFRNYDKGGLLGATISVLLFSALAWGLGYLWGRIKLPKGKTGQSNNSAGTTPQKGTIALGVVGLVILGLVGLSALKTKTGGKDWSQDLGVRALPADELNVQAENSPRKTETDEEVLSGQRAGGPEGSKPDLAALFASADAGDADLQYSLALNLLFGDFDFLQAQRPTAYRPWTVGVAGETPSLRQGVVDGVITDEEALRDLAVAYLRKAAEQRHALAQFALYECYSHSIGVKDDSAKTQARAWLRRASDNGQIEALLEEASLTPLEDIDTRFILLRRAAEQGNPAAKYFAACWYIRSYLRFLDKELGPIFGKRVKNPFDFGDEESKQDQKDDFLDLIQFDWTDPEFLKSAKALRASCPDWAAARSLYCASAEQGYPPAQWEAYGLLIEEKGKAQQAIEYLKAAAQTGHYGPMLDLAREYKGGENVPKDEVSALAWAYLVRAHPEFTKAGIGDEDPELQAILKQRDAEIRAFEEGLGAESRIKAQELAARIQQSIDERNSPWRNLPSWDLPGL